MATRILVTGATGTIGGPLVRLLGQRGYEVHALLNRREVPAGVGAGATWHELDLLAGDAAGVLAAVQPAGLFHLAWSAAPGTSNDEVNTRWLQASRKLLLSFYEHGGARALVAGTCFEYDWREGLCSEDRTPLAPATLYGRCKMELFQFTRDLCERERLGWAWGRIFFVYGPGEHPARFVPSVVRSLLRREPARCSHGAQVRDYLYAEDVAAGLTALYESDWNGDCNIASGHGTTLRELAERIADRLDGRELLAFGALPSPPDEPPVIVGDVERSRRVLGWRPDADSMHGIDETIEHWRRRLPAGSEKFA